MNFRSPSILPISGILIAGALWQAQLASAAIVTYTDRILWEAAVAASPSCEDFESEILAPFATSPTPYTTNAGVLFDTLTTPVTMQFLDPGLLGSGELHWRDFTAGVRISFPSTICAFGFDYDNGGAPGDDQTLTANGVATFIPNGATGFIGYIEDTGAPIPFLDMVGATGAQGGISIDDLCWATCASCSDCEIEILEAVTADASVTGACGFATLETLAENVSNGDSDVGVKITNNGSCSVFLIWFDPVLNFEAVAPGTERRLLLNTAPTSSVFGLCLGGTTCDYTYKLF